MHLAEIPGRSATVLSDVVILLLCFELHTDARACARAAEIPGIDPGSSVLLLNASSFELLKDARARRGNSGHRSRK
jgi:hypothetical protein